MLKADRGQNLPQYIYGRMEEVRAQHGAHATTIYNRIFGDGAYFTTEPRNIQAILATQFKDFGLGERRNGNFFPLLGSGIVRDLPPPTTWFVTPPKAVDADLVSVFFRWRTVGSCEKFTSTTICTGLGK